MSLNHRYYVSNLDLFVRRVAAGSRKGTSHRNDDEVRLLREIQECDLFDPAFKLKLSDGHAG